MVEQAYICQVIIATILTLAIVLPLFKYRHNVKILLEIVKYQMGNAC